MKKINKQTGDSIEFIVQKWEKEESLYEELEKIVKDYLKSEINELEVLPTISSRVKSLNSIIKTASKKGKKYSHLYDKLGIRIVCHFKSEVQKINNFISENFLIKEYKKKTLNTDQVGYLSDHFTVKIKEDRFNESINPKLKSLYFEIQIRTLCQHAWADTEHDILYKNEIFVDDCLKRRINRIAALLEISDDEFEYVNNELRNRKEYLPLLLMKSVEGKFFKYAKRDYDRDISYNHIDIFIKLFHSENINKEINSLIKFIDSNDKKIRRIFNEQQNELEIDIFFSQPEIFLIWYLLDKQEFNLRNLWKKYFQISELAKYALFWGKCLVADNI